MGSFDIIGRKEAKSRGLPRFFTGRSCKHGHLAERFVSSGACVICGLERLAQWRADNPERVQQSTREWWTAHPEKNVAKVRRWQRANPDKVAVHKARRRAARIQACPKWIPARDFYAIYRECRALTKSSGQLYHVDHIVPLKGKAACGLHVPWNLRILPARENLLKGVKLYDVG